MSRYEHLLKLGISEHELLSAANEIAARLHSSFRAAHSLSEAEEAILASMSEVVKSEANPHTPVKSIAEYAMMHATSYTFEQIQTAWHVSASGLRQRIEERSLLTITVNGKLRFPRFQFDDRFDIPTEIPCLDVVLKSIDKDVDILSIQRFLETSQVDLPSEHGDTLSPKEWLRLGYSVDPLISLAREL